MILLLFRKSVCFVTTLLSIGVLQQESSQVKVTVQIKYCRTVSASKFSFVSTGFEENEV